MKKKAPEQFSRFSRKKSNAAIKEQFKKEKRISKKEREAFFEKKKSDKGFNPRQKIRQANEQQPAPGIPYPASGNQTMPLNKYMAHCGICSRRDAAEMVRQDKVKVNGKIISDPGFKVNTGDEVRFNGKKIQLEKNLVYILMNKPKDYLTTTDDPDGRKTVMDIIQKATPERVYPVGRLDRNTSGVLLLTNDGELAQKLTHPRNEIKKVYHVTLNKPLDRNDFDRILNGITLEDGPVFVDGLAYADIKDKTQIGIEIHSGRNRIVRRIFEHLKYDVKNLDRVMFAGLTKKNVERGKWRFLKEKEVRELKFFSRPKPFRKAGSKIPDPGK